jgi:6-phosphogluconolactonase
MPTIMMTLRYSCAAWILSLSLLLTASSAYFSVAPRSRSFRRPSHGLLATPITYTAPASSDNIVVLKDADAVAAKIQEILHQAANKAIEERGHFCLGIPGGSILKMLVGSGADCSWTTQTTMAYVNHKCVDLQDDQLATHAKACKLFLSDWKECHTLVLTGSADADVEAANYISQLQALSPQILPRNAQGLPVFDLLLIGVGDDGHIGSLYAHQPQVLVDADGPWVLPVSLKHPPSITLSLPVLAAATKVVVAACGVSDKYPQGKSDGMRRAIQATDESINSFPAVGLRPVAMWVLDQAAASKL